jgi:hypothetical protein
VRRGSRRPDLRACDLTGVTGIDRPMKTVVTEPFTQTDPLQPTVGQAYPSTYIYANNNPNMYVDPSGLRATGGAPSSLALTSNPIASTNPCVGKVPAVGNYKVLYNGGCYEIPDGTQAVTNSKGEFGYVPSKYCKGRNDSASQCTITGLDVFRDSGAGQVLGNPVFQVVATVVVCSTSGPGGCAAVSFGFAAYNSGVRFAEDGYTTETVGLAAVDFALAGVKLNKAQSFRINKSIGPGVLKFFPYGTTSMTELVRKSAGQIIVKNVVVATGTGATSYAVNKAVK